MKENPIYQYLKENGLTDLDEKSFLDKYSNENNAKEIFDYFKSEGMTDLDFGGFHGKYLKKKEPPLKSPDLLGNLNFQSPTPKIGGKRPLQDKEIYDLAKKRKELSSIQRSGQQMAPAYVSSTDDAFNNAQKELENVNAQLKAAGYDPEAMDEIASFDAVPRVNDVLSMGKRKRERVRAATNYQASLYNGAIQREGAEGKKYLNELIGGAKVFDFNSQREYAARLRDAILKYSDPKDREKMISNLSEDVSYVYAGDLPGKKEQMDALAEQLPHLNEYQRQALLMMQDIDPDKFQHYTSILAKDPNGEWLGAKEESTLRGYEQKARELESIGVNMDIKRSVEDLEDLKKKLEQTGSTEDAQKYNAALEKYNAALQASSTQTERYPRIGAVDADEAMQEKFGQTSSWVSRFASGMGSFVDNQLEFLSGVVDGAYSGKNSLDDLYKLGNKRLSENANYQTDANSLTPTGRIITLPKEGEDLIEAIKNDPKLSDTDKRDAIRDVYMRFQDVAEYSVDPKKKRVNLTASALLNGVATVGSQLFVQVAETYMTGGTSNIAKMGNLFGSSLTSAYDSHYTDALSRGINNPAQYALNNSTIDALSELISPDYLIAKKLIDPMSAAGKIMNKISKSEWDSIVGRGAGRFARMKEAIGAGVVSGIKTALSESLEEVSGAIATEYTGERMFGQEANYGASIKDSFINTIVPMLAMGGLAAPFKYKSVQSHQKYSLYDAGQNFEKYSAAIERDLENKVIDQDEANLRKKSIDMAKKAYDKVPETNMKGEILTDNQKAEYAFLVFTEAQAKENIKNATEATNESLKTVLADIDKQKDDIINDRGPLQSVSVQKPQERAEAQAQGSISVQMPVGKEVDKNSTTNVEKDTKNDYLAEPDLFDTDLSDMTDKDVTIKVKDAKTGETVDKTFKASTVKNLLKNRTERLTEAMNCLTK